MKSHQQFAHDCGLVACRFDKMAITDLEDLEEAIAKATAARDEEFRQEVLKKAEVLVSPGVLKALSIDILSLLQPPAPQPPLPAWMRRNTYAIADLRGGQIKCCLESPHVGGHVFPGLSKYLRERP